MASNLHEVSDDQLEDLLVQCIETINVVCDRLEQDALMTHGVRSLVTSSDMLPSFNELTAENRENAGTILNAAIAVLVNTQSVRAIQAEQKRRSNRWN